MANKVIIRSQEKLDYGRREALNSLKTNLSFCGDNNKVILFTSCTPNEGKSTIVMELCSVLAKDGRRVILVDADLRKSVLVGRHRITSEQEIFGLSHYLSGQKKLQDVILTTDIDNMDMVVAGPMVPDPTGLLGNEYFQDMISALKQEYDMVLIDCPPLGWVIDAAVVAPACDSAILVVESNAISYRYVQEVKKQLELTGVRILGTVLNKVKTENNGYYSKYGGHYGKYGKYGKYSKYGEYGYYGKEGEYAGTADK